MVVGLASFIIRQIETKSVEGLRGRVRFRPPGCGSPRCWGVEAVSIVLAVISHKLNEAGNSRIAEKFGKFAQHTQLRHIRWL